MRLKTVWLSTAIAALLATTGCGEDIDQDGVLRIVNPFGEPITVVITFPDGQDETVPLNTQLPETLVGAPFVAGETYTFNATTGEAGVMPANPTNCVVAESAVDSREAEIQVFTPSTEDQLTIDCGPGFEVP